MHIHIYMTTRERIIFVFADCFTLGSENERIARYTRKNNARDSAGDLKRPKNDDCVTL